jgi:hypothetical protein
MSGNSQSTTPLKTEQLVGNPMEFFEVFGSSAATRSAQSVPITPVEMCGFQDEFGLPSLSDKVRENRTEYDGGVVVSCAPTPGRFLGTWIIYPRLIPDIPASCNRLASTDTLLIGHRNLDERLRANVEASFIAPLFLPLLTDNSDIAFPVENACKPAEVNQLPLFGRKCRHGHFAELELGTPFGVPVLEVIAQDTERSIGVGGIAFSFESALTNRHSDELIAGTDYLGNFLNRNVIAHAVDTATSYDACQVTCEKYRCAEIMQGE